VIQRNGVDLRSTEDHRAPITEEGGHGAVQDTQLMRPIPTRGPYGLFMRSHRSLPLTKLRRFTLPFSPYRDLVAQPEQTLSTLDGEPSRAEFAESPV
jgi:hypothetical protein